MLPPSTKSVLVTILSLLLNDYPLALDTPDIKFQLMKPQSPGLFIAQSGLIGAEAETAPNHESLFTAAGESFVMADGQDSLSVDLSWSHTSGINVIKRFTFTRGAYAVEVQHIIENKSGKSWTAREYRQLQRSPSEDTGQVFMYTYTGGAIYSPENKYEKISFDDLLNGKI